VAQLAAPAGAGRQRFSPQFQEVPMSRQSLCFTLVLLAACAGADETALQEPELGHGAGAAEPVLIDTIVQLSPDGTVTEVLQQVTAAERAAQHRARSLPVEEGAPQAEIGQARAALSINPSCATADLWLYDADMSHRLCISGSDLEINEVDYLDLESATYCRPRTVSTVLCLQRVSWAGKAAYIYPGSNAGSLISSSAWALLGASFPFSAWGPFQAIDPIYSGVVELHGYFLH
jgi:hypothetical protein